MKKIKLLLFSSLMLAAMFSFTSCSDDDDNDGDNNSIVGTWLFNKADISEMESTFSAEDNAKIKKHYEDNAKYYGIYEVTLNADGTLTERDIDSGDSSEKGTYKFENGILTIIWGEDDNNEFAAKLEKGVLTIYYDESDEYAQPSTLTEAGVADPYSGEVTKFTGKVDYSRK